MRCRYLFIPSLVGLLLFACQGDSPSGKMASTRDTPKPLAPVAIDLPQILQRGKLIALTRYNANSYFIYRGQPMGYEYELLTLFAQHLGVDLEIKVPAKWDTLFNLLYRGEGDIIAANLTVTKERARKVKFAHAHTTTRQVLVQRKPQNWRQMKLHQIEKHLIRNPIQLIGKKVYVRRSSAYYARLVNLSEEIGGDIQIMPAPEDLETEDLIRMVAKGEIDYTVADENIALINQAYYDNIDVATPLGVEQRIAWAVRPNAPLLLQAINDWLQHMKSSGDPTYYVIYNKYYKNKRSFRERMRSEFFSKTGGKISPYDSILQK
ncbi:MAG: lytic transglycosylase F, partial [Calditrichaeota bacterium]